MKMHRELIKRYTRHLTSGLGITEDDPMQDLSNFDRDILSMAAEATRDDNLDWLRLSLDALLANPGGRLRLFADHVYPLDDRELHALFAHAFRTIWPNEAISPLGSEADLQFVAMTDEEWADQINPKAMF